ncbi:hypothetical protein M413DRAFT_447192 [Hebeloma cylindrosporum]|uniref:Uncharacterized protein n=1 Tax=Hebeloma cylindrosporum TaxID=76867 RepID=A0A0C3C6N3_HEBCY|nr:hypothetical protein M413DRAFT_447192 [Hebeloma cylindrosporum h7]
MSASAVGFSRFQAIVTAKPLNGIGPPVLPEPIYPSPYEKWEVRFQNGKRTRELDDAGSKQAAKKTKRITEDDGGSTKEPTTRYQSREELLEALRMRFKQGPAVEFHGMYELIDPELSHKSRIQLVAYEIWKTTGYRFTVKDHPQVANGHKTRFWCSQDDAHRSKSSRAARKAQGDCYKPRVTSGGDAMAKARYPCRSRLLISSRDAKVPGIGSITVRMHHHVAHEPYADSNIRVYDGWESGWPVPRESPVSRGVNKQRAADSRDDDDGDSGGEESSPGDIYEPVDEGTQEDAHPPVPPIPSEPSHSLPPLVEKYHARMNTHIKNLREFCEGLEYQLQFNDYRMLDVLEQEGGSFLTLVADCLKKEGRLVSPDQPTYALLDTGQPLREGIASVSSLTTTDSHRTYDGSQGINPRALNY